MNPYQAHFPKAEANKLFENFIRSNDVMMQAIPTLANKVLGCWCEPNGASECQGDVLLKLYYEYELYNNM